MARFEVTTTQNNRGGLPKVNDDVVVDGIPGRVIAIDQFHGFTFRVTIPGLIVDGAQQFLDRRVSWDEVLDLTQSDA